MWQQVCPAEGQAAGLCPELVWRPGGLLTYPGTEQGDVCTPSVLHLLLWGASGTQDLGKQATWGSGPSLPCSRGPPASQVTGSLDWALLNDTSGHLSGGAWVDTSDQDGGLHGKPVKRGVSIRDEGLWKERVCNLCKVGCWCPG